MKKVQQPYNGWTNVHTMEAFENIVEEVYNQFPHLRKEIRRLVEAKTDIKTTAKIIKNAYKQKDVDYIKLAQIFTDLWKTDHMVLKTKYFTSGIFRIKQEDIKNVVRGLTNAVEDVFFNSPYKRIKINIQKSCFRRWCWFKTTKQAIDLLKQIKEQLPKTEDFEFFEDKITKMLFILENPLPKIIC